MINLKMYQTNKMKRLTIILAFLAVGQFAIAQNLAGTTFDATMGVLDASVPCMVDAGQQYGLDRWTGNNGACPGDGFCQSFTNIDPQYNTIYVKNIVNVPVCVTMNFITGSCGFNTGFWVVEGVYVPSAPGSGTDPCSQNTLIQSSTIGGTTSVGFEPEGCTGFSVNFHNGTFPSQQCTYQYSFDPDPLLDLRCGDETMCIQKVRIGGTPVPTMTEWGLFLFGLILLTLGVVTIYNMSVARATEEF